MNDRPLTRHQS